MKSIDSNPFADFLSSEIAPARELPEGWMIALVLIVLLIRFQSVRLSKSLLGLHV